MGFIYKCVTLLQPYIFLMLWHIKRTYKLTQVILDLSLWCTCTYREPANVVVCQHSSKGDDSSIRIYVKVLLRNIICNNGVPQAILQFESKNPTIVTRKPNVIPSFDYMYAN